MFLFLLYAITSSILRNLEYCISWIFLEAFLINQLIFGVASLCVMVKGIGGESSSLKFKPCRSIAPSVQTFSRFKYISPGCPRPTMELQVQNRGLRHKSFHFVLCKYCSLSNKLIMPL